MIIEETGKFVEKRDDQFEGKRLHAVMMPIFKVKKFPVTDYRVKRARAFNPISDPLSAT